MLEIGDPQEGETVVISAAAGAVGSVAGQLAKQRGARVVGIAGGPEKCAWLKDELGFEPPIIKVQVKSTEGNIGDPEVSSLYGKVGNGEHGLFVTLGGFTPKAAAFAKSKSNLRLIDGEDLGQLVFTHYDQFDSRYKGLLPLRRVYVPEVLDADEE